MFIFVYFFAFLTFLINHSSLYLFGGDSSEFSLVGSMWGVAHPPGYPLYTLLSNLVTRLIPISTITWRISLISSLSTIFASYFIYKLLRFMKVGNLVSLFSASFYVLLYPIWLYSLVPEVFALHNLLVILTTWLVFQFIKQNRLLYLNLIFLLIGVQFAHHHIFVLFIPAWGYLLYKNHIVAYLKKLPKKKFIMLMGLLVIGASIYIYAPIASYLSTNSIMDWENAKTFQGFIRLITRAMYGTFKAYNGSTGNIANQLYGLVSFVIFVFQDFRPLGLIFVVLGLFELKKKNKQLFPFVAISLSTHVFFYFYTNFYLLRPFSVALFERFLIPVYFILIIPFARGACFIQNKIVFYTIQYIKNRMLQKLTLPFFYVFLFLFIFIVCMQNYKIIKNISKLSVFNSYAKDLLNTPPKNAFIQIGLDNSYFPSAYLYFKERFRFDLKFIFLPLLPKQSYQLELKKRYPAIYLPKQSITSQSSMLDFLNKNNSNGIYFESPVATDSWRPYGLLWKYYVNAEESKKDEENLLKENRLLWNKIYTIPILDKEQKNILHLSDVQGQYIQAYLNFSKLLVTTKHIEEAENVIKNIYTNYKKNDFMTRMILINILVEQKKCQEASSYIKDMNFEQEKPDTEQVNALFRYYSTCDTVNTEQINRLKEIKKIYQKENNTLLKNL